LFLYMNDLNGFSSCCQLKKCLKCQKDKDFNSFYFIKKCNQYYSYCKQCERKRYTERRKKKSIFKLDNKRKWKQCRYCHQKLTLNLLPDGRHARDLNPQEKLNYLKSLGYDL